MPRGFLTLGDVAVEQWPALWDRAAYLKANRVQTTLAGKAVALVFEKASTRTRVSFEVGVFELGGHAVVLSSQVRSRAANRSRTPHACCRATAKGSCCGRSVRSASRSSRSTRRFP
jgi:ornithine carbamoyltransferase